MYLVQSVVVVESLFFWMWSHWSVPVRQQGLFVTVMDKVVWILWHGTVGLDLGVHFNSVHCFIVTLFESAFVKVKLLSAAKLVRSSRVEFQTLCKLHHLLATTLSDFRVEISGAVRHLMTVFQTSSRVVFFLLTQHVFPVNLTALFGVLESTGLQRMRGDTKISPFDLLHRLPQLIIDSLVNFGRLLKITALCSPWDVSLIPY